MCGVTEVAGEAGAGKTQLVLQLLLQSQLPTPLGGLGGGAIYLHSDSSYSGPAMKRLDTMAQEFAVRHAALQADSELLKQHILVMQVDSPDELWQVVDQRIPALLPTTQVRLLVVDSIGGLYRTLADDISASRASAHAQRAQQLMRLAARLKEISDQFNIATVVTNQVSDKPANALAHRSAAPWELGACGMADGSARVPALGMAWACCVNTRLILTRQQRGSTHGPGGWQSMSGHSVSADEEWPQTSSWNRRLHVVWSSRLPESSTGFEVRDRGLVGVMP